MTPIATSVGIPDSLSLSLSPLWQILYANEGESKKEPEVEPLPIGEKSSYICHKGHEFIPTLYHFPTNCEACTKPLWNMFKPPPALECRRCHIKCHKDHMDRKEEVIAPCRGGRSHARLYDVVVRGWSHNITIFMENLRRTITITIWLCFRYTILSTLVEGRNIEGFFLFKVWYWTI